MTTTRDKMKPGASALPPKRAGCALWWSASLIEADPASLRAAMALHCERYVDLVRAPVGPHAAMRRALRRCASGMPEGRVWREVGIDKAPALATAGTATPETELVVAFARETTDIAQRTYNATDEWSLSVNDKTGKVSTSTDAGKLPNDELVQLNRVLERYRKERLMLTQEDIRGLMLRVFLEDAMGSRLKMQGSIYFLPSTALPLRDAKRNTITNAATSKPEMRAADEVIDELAPVLAVAGIKLWRIPILSDDAATTQQIAGAVGESLLDEVEKMAKEALERVEASKRGESKMSTLQERLEQAAALRSKARVYRELLGLGIGDAEKALDAAEKLIEDAMADAAAGGAAA